MASPDRSGLVHYMGECDCGKSWYSKNVMGLAAQHAARCSGQVRVELGRVFIWNARGGAPPVEETPV